MRQNNSVKSEPAEKIYNSLPKLPSSMRYYDEFADTWHSVKELESSNEWRIEASGNVYWIRFASHQQKSLIPLLKRWVIWAFSKLSPTTVVHYHRVFENVLVSDCPDSLQNHIFSNPLRLKELWYTKYLLQNDLMTLVSLKSFLQYCCESSVGLLGPGYLDFIGALRLPDADKYAAVRAGDVFLNAQEEKSIIEFLDNIALKAKSVNHMLSVHELRAACLLCILFQFGMRPAQIAKVRISDVKIYRKTDERDSAVHITFFKTKQRNSKKRLPLIRKVKQEWAVIFIIFIEERPTAPPSFFRKRALSDSFLGLTPASVRVLVNEITQQIFSFSRPPNHFRHSAAQRLVDAGASQYELAEFMGHSRIDTGLVYFDSSPTQAAKINKALALSPVYNAVIDVARNRFIDKSILLGIDPDKQIGGVPHGIPIAGIGACEEGQSLCSKNPILSCYDCANFLAVSDVNVHTGVLDSLRSVVKLYYDTSRGEVDSPAYLQLRTTLDSVQNTIHTIKDDRIES